LLGAGGNDDDGGGRPNAADGAPHPPVAATAGIGTGCDGGCAQSFGAAVAAGTEADLAPQREGFAAESPIVEGTVAEGTDDVPLAIERLELTPRGFFLKSFSNLSRFEYVFGPQVNPFQVIPM
jgi:hypothetical protein